MITRYIIIGVTIAITVLGISAYYFSNINLNQDSLIKDYSSEPETIYTNSSATIVATNTYNSIKSSNIIQNETQLIVPEITGADIVSHMVLYDFEFLQDTKSLTRRQYSNNINMEVWKDSESSSTPKAITISSDGNVWYTDDVNHRIGRLQPLSKEITEWSLPSTSSYPRGISAVSDRSIWFVEVGANNISNLNPFTNEVTEWSIPTSNSHPIDVVIDLEGKVFFTEDNGNKISRLDPLTNELTGWSVPTKNPYTKGYPYNPSSRPFAIALDNDGNVWFTEIAGNKIGRLNPITNEILEWLFPIKLGFPMSIAIDPSGNAFFTTDADNKIVRLNPLNGEMTEWDLPTNQAYPSGITTDNFGNVWFIESATSKIARLMPSSNEITEWSIPASSFARAITTDSDGNIWFIKSLGKSFAKLNINSKDVP